MVPLFPATIRQIQIFNPCNITREIPACLLETLSQVHPQSAAISVTETLETERDDILYIIICPLVLDEEQMQQAPLYFICYQLDPYQRIVKKPHYAEFLTRALYNWDYSSRNVLADVNNSYRLLHVIPGYTSSLEMIGSDLPTRQDIDVLFLCNMGYPRRRQIYDDLQQEGVIVVNQYDLSLEEMVKYITRSKICVNVGAEEEFPLETLRLSILLANRACIVCEDKPGDPEIEIYRPYLCITKDVVSRCRALLSNSSLRLKLAQKGYRWYREQRQWQQIVDFNALLPSLAS